MESVEVMGTKANALLLHKCFRTGASGRLEFTLGLFRRGRGMDAALNTPSSRRDCCNRIALRKADQHADVAHALDR